MHTAPQGAIDINVFNFCQHERNGGDCAANSGQCPARARPGEKTDKCSARSHKYYDSSHKYYDSFYGDCARRGAGQRKRPPQPGQPSYFTVKIANRCDPAKRRGRSVKLHTVKKMYFLPKKNGLIQPYDERNSKKNFTFVRTF